MPLILLTVEISYNISMSPTEKGVITVFFQTLNKFNVFLEEGTMNLLYR